MTASPSPEKNSAPFKIGLVGYGKMGASMVSAWKKSNLIDSIDVLDTFAIDNFIIKDEKEFLSKSMEWDVLVLAVKPQNLDVLFAEQEIKIPENLPILSILAGKTLMDLSDKFRGNRPIVRCMPNTPASIGKGMSVAIANNSVTAAQKDMVFRLLSEIGLFAWTNNESDMDIVTAMSGSGPAYVFYMIEAMSMAGEKAGLSPEFSMMLARQTIIGSAALAEHAMGETVESLRKNVTSPNGTTAAGLCVLMDGRFQEILNETIYRAAARSKELSSS